MWTLRRPVLGCLAATGALACLVPAMTTSAAGAVAHPRPVVAYGSGGVKPGRLGELDCNGFSPIQRSVKPGLACAEPRGEYGGRFLDNGHYIGHDEPSVRFLSTTPGSGSNFSITESLPRDPVAMPTVRTPART